MPDLDDRLPAIDDRFRRWRADRNVPGVAWGVVREGELVHADGDGTARDGEDRRPDADTVFRIASMTKSFTAATVLCLRDEGRLGLDDPAEHHVPALAGWRSPAPDAGPVTIRQLLTMTSGLPTDDPWGDRQQGLAIDAFERLLAAGPRIAWTPGTAFDYSNLGYGILGRVISGTAGAEYREVVADRLLAPLGLAATAYREEDVPADRLAHGYVRQDGTLVREGMDAYGALASMGGVYSTVRDLARWVAFFLDTDAPGPLRPPSRREMQQVQRFETLELPAHAADAAAPVTARGYGFGLFVAVDPELGTLVSHSGGYPGYGSNMTWHPASGLGMVALANLRYAGPSVPVRAAIQELVRADRDEARRRRHVVRPWPELEAARALVARLLAAWDDEAADAAFAMNMDLDEPRAARRAAFEAAAALGPFEPDAEAPVALLSAAEGDWWLRGPRGRVRVELLLTPEPAPRIQGLHLVVVGDPSEALETAARALLAESAAGPAAGRLPDWPASLRAGAGVDPAAVTRSLVAAWARFGAMDLGRPIAGDGSATTTWELRTERGGEATLKVALDPATGDVTEVAVLAAERKAPVEAR